MSEAFERRPEAASGDPTADGARGPLPRRGLRQALTESETRFRTIFESEPACVKLVAEDGTLLSMNPAGREMLRAPSEDALIGANVYDLICPRDRAAFVALNERVFAGEHAHLEFRIHDLEGDHRQMETFAAPLSDETGQIVAQLAVTHDISERKREQAELHAYRERLEALVAERTRELEASRETARRSEQLAALGTLAAGLAHELNNPLGTILLGVELAAQAEDDATLDEALAGIRRDVERCSHIVKSMLRFGRNEPSEKRPLSLNRVVRAARDDAREVVDRRCLVLDLATDLPLVEGNATELGQVLLNLIQNAVHASPVGARIEITTRRRDGDVECRVRDRGRGMSSETASRARDPFFTTRQSSGGSGLGLSVSHGIVVEHRGLLSIESREGEGTVVRIRLPALDAAEHG